jgi:citrate lyase beta subunit
MTDSLRPRRSVLYLPANRDSAIAKARTLASDCVILDLEDAVQPAAKAEARAAAVAAARAGGWGRRELLLRVNGMTSAEAPADFAAAVGAGFDAIVVPKVESVAAAQAAVAAAAGVPVWAMIETPRGVLAAADIAAVPGVAALVAGMADLAKDLRCRPDAARTPLLYALSAIVLAARAGGVLVFDGVFTNLQDGEGFAAEARQALMMGFDGKTLIHPSQIDPCNAVFSPDADEIAEARALVAAYDAGLASGAGVTTYKGKMVEIIHVIEARRVLALASVVG